MTTLTPQELSALWKKYDSKQEKLLKEAEKAVIQWKYASEIMAGVIPYSDQLWNGLRSWGKWQPTKRHWLTGKLPPDWCEHGFDEEGRVRLIRQKTGSIKVFIYKDDVIDALDLGGVTGLFLTRDVMKRGRVQVEYTYSRTPHQYTHEVFKYQGDRCVSSVEKGWYFKNPKEKWVATTPKKYAYEADDEGLVRAYRDMGAKLGGNELVFERPEAKPAVRRPKPLRRPLVAYTLAIKKSKAGPRAGILAEAHALEAGIHEEWPFDTVIVTHPDHVDVVTKETELTARRNVFAGADGLPASGTVAPLKHAKAKWILIYGNDDDAHEHFQQALAERFSIIFHAKSPAQVETFCRGLTRIDPKALAIAFPIRLTSAAKGAQAKALEIREILREHSLDQCRVIAAAAIPKGKIVDYVSQPDIDGVFVEKTTSSEILELLKKIATY